MSFAREQSDRKAHERSADERDLRQLGTVVKKMVGEMSDVVIVVSEKLRELNMEEKVIVELLTNDDVSLDKLELTKGWCDRDKDVEIV